MSQQPGVPKKTTLKMKNAIMDYVLHPTDTIKAIAERNNVKYDSLRMAIQREQEFIKEESMKIWQSKVIMCQRVMEQKAERGDFKSLDFILRSCGIVPEQKITNNEQEIRITIDKKEDE